MAAIKSGPVEDFSNFCGPVIHAESFKKIKSYLDSVNAGKNPGTSVLVGGEASDAIGYYIQPTALLSKDPKSPTMVDELFGPVVTIYSYPADEFLETLELADSTSSYALTCGIFAQDRDAIMTMRNKLRNAAGNLYVNDKSTGAVVGQQPFGGGRDSGTNDKAGSAL